MDLNEYLVSRHFTQQEFADKVDIGIATLQRYLAGKVAPPLDIADRIIKATNNKVTFEDLLENFQKKS